MKKVFLLLITLFIMTACSHESTPNGGLRHVVSFKFKPEASEAQVNALVEALAGLEKTIPQIKAFEWGLNNSPEPYHKGMTHIFLITFDDEKGRDEYLIHPDHVAFGEQHGSIIEDAVVVDYLIK